MRISGIPHKGGAGAPTGFARTVPMKGRARQRSWVARVRKSKSDFLARRADSRRFAVGFFSCVYTQQPPSRIGFKRGSKTRSGEQIFDLRTRLINLMSPHQTTLPKFISPAHTHSQTFGLLARQSLARKFPSKTCSAKIASCAVNPPRLRASLFANLRFALRLGSTTLANLRFGRASLLTCSAEVVRFQRPTRRQKKKP